MRPIYSGAEITDTAAMLDPPDHAVPEPDPRVHEALTDMHAYVLVLDAEWRSTKTGELRQELDALRAALAALHERLDPGGHYL
jgi:hypothetical protein